MLGNIDVREYFVIGYVITYLTLETAWHFAPCNTPYKTIKPCMYKRKKEMDSKKLRGVISQ